MKKIILTFIMILVLAGCACGEYFRHDTVWKNWTHAWKSNFGQMTKQDVDKGYWGCPVIVK